MKKSIITLMVFILVVVLMTGYQSKSLSDDSHKSPTGIEGYELIREYFIDYKFDVEHKQNSFHVKGEYDLNNDKIRDKIDLIL